MPATFWERAERGLIPRSVKIRSSNSLNCAELQRISPAQFPCSRTALLRCSKHNDRLLRSLGYRGVSGVDIYALFGQLLRQLCKGSWLVRKLKFFDSTLGHHGVWLHGLISNKIVDLEAVKGKRDERYVNSPCFWPSKRDGGYLPCTSVLLVNQGWFMPVSNGIPMRSPEIHVLITALDDGLKAI